MTAAQRIDARYSVAYRTFQRLNTSFPIRNLRAGDPSVYVRTNQRELADRMSRITNRARRMILRAGGMVTP